MHKFVPVLALIATVPIWIDVPVAAELHSAAPLSSPFAIDVAGAGAAVVLVAGKGGGTGGGATTGGMGGATTGGMGGGATTGGNNAQPSYYTYQCATPAGGCSFVAPASFRSSSLRAGAPCSCADGQRQGQLK